MLWPVPSVFEEPNLNVERWQVYETNTGDRHLVGYCPERFEGRVSSAIATFDPKKAYIVTVSGRSYALIGEPGFDGEGDHVWQGWKVINSVASEGDISQEVWGEIQAARNSKKASRKRRIAVEE